MAVSQRRRSNEGSNGCGIAAPRSWRLWPLHDTVEDGVLRPRIGSVVIAIGRLRGVQARPVSSSSLIPETESTFRSIASLEGGSVESEVCLWVVLVMKERKETGRTVR